MILQADEMGLTDLELIIIIVVESIFLVSLFLLSVIALKKYKEKKALLRFYVLIFMAINLIMFIQMVVSKIMVLNGDLPIEDPWIQGFGMICFLFTNIVCWYIYSEVFITQESNKKTSRILFVVISLIALGIYLFIQNDTAEGIFFGIFFILALIVFVGMMVSSFKVMKRLDDKLDKLRMKLLFATGFSIIFTLFLSLINQVLRYSNIIQNSMQGLYLFYIGLGLLPVLLVYLAFFNPDWLTKRYIVLNEK